MTISHRNTTGNASGTTTGLSFTMPTGHALDDLLITWIGAKPYSCTVSAGTILTDYTLLASATSGTVANGVGVGSTFAQARYRVHDGSETVPSATLSATPSPRLSAMSAYSKTNPGAWNIQSSGGFDGTPSGSSLQVISSGNLDCAVGDTVLVMVVGPDDTAVPLTPTLSGIVAAFSAGVQRIPTVGTTAGNDGVLTVWEFTCTTAGSGTLTFASTLANSGEAEAAGVFIRLREPAAVAVTDYWGSAA